VCAAVTYNQVDEPGDQAQDNAKMDAVPLFPDAQATTAEEAELDGIRATLVDCGGEGK
jgi:hypothetical protein